MFGNITIKKEELDRLYNEIKDLTNERLKGFPEIPMTCGFCGGATVRGKDFKDGKRLVRVCNNCL